MNHQLVTILAEIKAPDTGALVSFLIYAAIAGLVLWGLVELFKWLGWGIPRPVVIIFTVLLGILLILWIAKLFNFLT